MTDADFAALVGCDRSTVTRIRAGQFPSSATLRKIQEVTRGAVTPNDLMGAA